MRCATLAEQLRAEGAEILFICRELPGDCCAWLAGRGFAVQRLAAVAAPSAASAANAPVHAAWLGVPLEQERQETEAALAAHGPFDWLVVDNYALDARWERAMRPHAQRILVIDDLADRSHDCELLLDQNLLAGGDRRYSGKVPDSCGLMLGPDYALLQPVYGRLHPRMPTRSGPVRTLLIFFGGADPADVTGRALAAFRSLGREDVIADVVVGVSNPRRGDLAGLAAGMSNIRLHDGLPSLAPLMASADLALGAGGATSWERCCLGLPSLVVTLADNQRPIAAELHRRGLVRWLGHVGEVGEAALAAALKQALGQELPEQWSRDCLALLDGRGVDRVAAVLTASSAMRLRLRPALPSDEAMLLRWTNDPIVRKESFTTGPIDSETHRQWFNRRLRDIEGCRIYIAETESNIPVGQARFDFDGEGWEVGYSLDSLYRGRGVGRQLLTAALLRLRAEMPDSVVIAKVKARNRASRRIFEALGFEAKDCGGEIHCLLRYAPITATALRPTSSTTPRSANENSIA